MNDCYHLLVEEEYGHRTWYACLSPLEYQVLRRRWQSMRGLSCLVPVPLIIPQAQEVDFYTEYLLQIEYRTESWISAHIHECDDSRLGDLGGCPEGDRDVFVLDGVEYRDGGIELFTNREEKPPYPTSPVLYPKLVRGDAEHPWYIIWQDTSEAGIPRFTKLGLISVEEANALDEAWWVFNGRVKKKENIEVVK